MIIYKDSFVDRTLFGVCVSLAWKRATRSQPGVHKSAAAQSSYQAQSASTKGRAADPQFWLHVFYLTGAPKCEREAPVSREAYRDGSMRRRSTGALHATEMYSSTSDGHRGAYDVYGSASMLKRGT